MSNLILPHDLTVPASCTPKQARDLYRALARACGENSLADGKVTSETIYAYGIALAALAAADNQSAPLERIKARMGAKPTKGQSERLQYWANATAAGRSFWKHGAESIPMGDILAHGAIQPMSPAGLKAAAERAALEKKAVAERAANEARAAAVAKAAAAAGEAAAARAAAELARNVAAAYADAMTHGHHMDATPMPSIGRPARAIAAAERAATLATLKAQGEEAARIAAADRVRAAAEFQALAELLGIALTAEQAAALDPQAAAMAAANAEPKATPRKVARKAA